MLKKFKILLPLPYEDSFNLVKKSGDEITSWRTNNFDLKEGYIEWKQSFWSLTGASAIFATFKKKRDDRTIVLIQVHKPLQIVDPLGICDKIFQKLNKKCQEHLRK